MGRLIERHRRSHATLPGSTGAMVRDFAIYTVLQEADQDDLFVVDLAPDRILLGGEVPYLLIAPLNHLICFGSEYLSFLYQR